MSNVSNLLEGFVFLNVSHQFLCRIDTTRNAHAPMFRDFPEIVVNFLKGNTHTKNLGFPIVKSINGNLVTHHVLRTTCYVSHIKNYARAPVTILLRERELVIGDGFD